jgi:cellobiose epimerase
MTVPGMSIRQFRQEVTDELVENILPYWSSKMVDNERGGFYGQRDGFDRLVAEADKGVILNMRILWTFSRAAYYVSDAYRALATRAFDYIVEHFVDAELGGVYWAVDCNGAPVNTKKQIYAQAFGIYALSEYYMLTNDERSLELAIHLFDLIEKYSFDKQYNGYLEAFTRQWELLDDLRLSDKDANEKKTMNTHLHVLEAYTNLYRCWPDDLLRVKLSNLISVFRNHIITGKVHFGLFFTDNWELRSDKISYGHDIEGSWLLYEAAAVLDDEALMGDTAQISVDMVDVALEKGMDPDNGLKNENVDIRKDWWPQAEALVGLVNAWQLTRREHYLTHAFGVWNFIKEKLIDRAEGEWFWGVDERGEVIRSEDKAGPWKCPYHNSRAMFELLNRLPKSEIKGYL